MEGNLEDLILKFIATQYRKAEDEKDAFKRACLEKANDSLYRLWLAAEAGKFDKSGIKGAEHFAAVTMLNGRRDGARRQLTKKAKATGSLDQNDLGSTLPAEVIDDVDKRRARLVTQWLLSRDEWPLIAQQIVDGKTPKELAELNGWTESTFYKRRKDELTMYRRRLPEFEAFCYAEGSESMEILRMLEVASRAAPGAA